MIFMSSFSNSERKPSKISKLLLSLSICFMNQSKRISFVILGDLNMLEVAMNKMFY